MAFDYLKDTDHITLDEKVSSLIPGEFPEFFREDGKDLVNFFKTYYKFLETNELVISSIEQNEYFVTTEREDPFLLEDGDNLVLESSRTTTSAFSKGEKIKGQSSGAEAIVDRNIITTDTLIFASDLTRKNFDVGEIIVGQTNRCEAKVVSFRKNPLFASRTLLRGIDVDSTSEDFLDYFRKEFLSDLPENLETDKRLLLKHIIKIYRSKGSTDSFKSLFKALYDIQDLDIYYPKNDLLKPSSGDWRRENTLRIITDDSNDKFESRTITGQLSSATAIVDRVENFVSGALQVTELFLTDISGTFIVGETVQSSTYNGTTGSGVTQGVLTDINIISAGTNYLVGDVVSVTGGGGQDAAARVETIGTGSIRGFTVYDGGDGYINGTALSVNNFATGGDGVTGEVSGISHTFSFTTVQDIIADVQFVTLNSTEFGLQGSTTANVANTLIEALGFAVTQIGAVSNVKATGLGTGYEASPIISLKQPEIKKFSETGISILNLNSDPDSSSLTNAISGSFTIDERITSATGQKVGTFHGIVATESTIDDPTRIRFKPLHYLGAFGLGRYDLIPNTTNYINTTAPAIYDIQIVQTGNTTTNTFKYRRGVNAASANSTNASNTDFTEYTNTPTTITAEDQKLTFPVSSITRSSTTATVTTPKKHGFVTGQKVIISGATQAEYNGQQTITVASTTTFTYTVSGSPATPATTASAITYDENVAVRFTLPFGHESDDRYLMSTVNFTNDDIITGFRSNSQATVNTGVAVADGGIRGNNATVDVSGLAAGSVKSIEITNFGVGYATPPTVSLATKGGGNANLTANIGAVGVTPGSYRNRDGQLSSEKKLIDSNFYQDYSYSLRSTKQLSKYKPTVEKLLHPAGMKMFGELRDQEINLQMGFDNIFQQEQSGDAILLEDGDNILTELYFDPTHSIQLNQNKLLSNASGGTISYTGNSVTITGSDATFLDLETATPGGSGVLRNEDQTRLELNESTGTDFANDYPENSTFVIDDEQAFIVSYGELLLENSLIGTLNSSSSNVLSTITITNTTATFSVGETVTQKTDDVLTLEPVTDASNTTTIGDLLLETSNTTFVERLTFNDQTTTGSGIVHSYFTDPANNKILILHSSNGAFLTSANAEGVTSGASANLSSFSNNLIYGVGTDFEDDLRVDDDITIVGISGSMKVTEIINSSAIICNTTIGTGVTLYFDNSTIKHNFLNETSIRGTTSANGILDGSTTITGANTFFDNDLDENDIITLSSNTSQKVQVTSITNSTQIVVNTAIGDGSSNQTFNFVGSRRLDFERNRTVLTLNRPYLGSNNFLRVNDTIASNGFLLLEDGVGLLNVEYQATTSTKGTFQFEDLSTFSEQSSKFITII